MMKEQYVILTKLEGNLPVLKKISVLTMIFLGNHISPIAKQNHHKSVLLQDCWQSSFLSRGDCCEKIFYVLIEGA